MVRSFSARAALVMLAVLLVLGLAGPQVWAWYHLREARAALARYHPEEARRSLGSCLLVWGDRPSVRLLACRAAWQDGDPEGALAELRAAQRLLGEANADTALEWALLRASGGKVGEVEEYLQKRSEQAPAEVGPLAWEALAVGYLRVYRTLDAMACVKHWLSRDTDNVRALELRGMAYVTGKGVVRGSEDYRRVLELDPGRKETRWRLAECLVSLGSYDEAAAQLEVIARDRPGDPDVAARLARCYNMLSRSEEARRLLDDALAAHPDHGLCLRTRGQFALMADQKAEAEEWLRKAAAALPEDYQTQFLLFQALQARGNTDEAKAQLRRAEEVRDRTERLGELQSRRLAEQPLDPGLHYETGLLLMRTGHPEVGEQWLLSALALDPDHKPSHAALADHYERLGDKARAGKHRKKAAE